MNNKFLKLLRLFVNGIAIVQSLLFVILCTLYWILKYADLFYNTPSGLIGVIETHAYFTFGSMILVIFPIAFLLLVEENG